MKLPFLLFALFFIGSLYGCGQHKSHVSPDQQKNPDSLQKSASETILYCLQNHEHLSRKEYKNAYKIVNKEYDAKKSDFNSLQLICFNVHHFARYNQYHEGMKQLSRYIATHPSDTSSLGGIQHLLKRIDRERILRWNVANKANDEKEGLILENKELAERNEQLKIAAEQDKIRLNELKKQIDQLKNIESIIKSREH